MTLKNQVKILNNKILPKNYFPFKLQYPFFKPQLALEIHEWLKSYEKWSYVDHDGFSILEESNLKDNDHLLPKKLQFLTSKVYVNILIDKLKKKLSIKENISKDKYLIDIHLLNKNEFIGMHNDWDEVHKQGYRIYIQFGCEKLPKSGGETVIYPKEKDNEPIVVPALHNLATFFEISKDSNHAIMPIREDIKRYSLIYTFYNKDKL
jgi:hypothetical protein